MPFHFVARPKDTFQVSCIKRKYRSLLIVSISGADPVDCTQYYFCSGPSGNSRVYQCPSGFAYNPLTRMCRSTSGSSENCAQINCTAENENRYKAYPGDRGYYAFCLEDIGVSAPIMFKCPDPVNFKFNETSQRCEFECRYEGRVPDYTNCQAYYECLLETSSSFIWQRQACIVGYIFNQYLEQCVPGNCSASDIDYYDQTTPDYYSTK